MYFWVTVDPGAQHIILDSSAVAQWLHWPFKTPKEYNRDEYNTAVRYMCRQITECNVIYGHNLLLIDHLFEDNYEN